MSLFVFFISLLIVAQHVSGNNLPIIRSWRMRDVIASCWYVPWLRGGCQVRLVGSASVDALPTNRTWQPPTRPSGISFTPARTVRRPLPPAPIFTKLANAPQHYVQISYRESQPNRTINVATTNRHSFTPYVKNGWHCRILRKPQSLYKVSESNFNQVRRKGIKHVNMFIYSWTNIDQLDVTRFIMFIGPCIILIAE